MGITILDDDDKFVKGFMTQVSGETIGFFVDQGWNKELLAHLLIEKVEKSHLGNEIENDPGTPDFGLFQKLLDGNLEDLRVSRGKSETTPKTVTTTVKNKPDGKETTEITKEAGKKITQQSGIIIQGSDANLVIRSPQGVLYYLGELARIELESDQEHRIPKIDGEKLFQVARGVGNASASEITVSFRGMPYHIPSNPESRSLQALSFVQQLINLQAKEVAPAPTTVRFVGQ